MTTQQERNLFFSRLFLVFFLVARYARVITTRLSSRADTRFESSGSSLLIAHWSFRCPCHVNWLLYVTVKERKLKYKTNQFLNVQQREGDIFHDQSSFVLWTVFFSFLFFFFFFLTMAPQELEKKVALLFMYRKIVMIFKSVELEHTPSSFPQSKRWSATVQSQKKGSSRRIYSCFFTHNGITTPKTTREGQESTTKISLHLAWPPKFKNQVLSTPRAQNRFLFLDYFYAVAGRNLEACLAAWKSSSP